ncbi:hypothetical protein [Gordonia sp. SND2]|uniref:hypothetical protein n=1 Tax=Gordonia sp. SND2 TaxID=3388659 RepID=UPI00398ABC56
MTDDNVLPFEAAAERAYAARSGGLTSLQWDLRAAAAAAELGPIPSGFPEPEYLINTDGEPDGRAFDVYECEAVRAAVTQYVGGAVGVEFTLDAGEVIRSTRAARDLCSALPKAIAAVEAAVEALSTHS